MKIIQDGPLTKTFTKCPKPENCSHVNNPGTWILNFLFRKSLKSLTKAHTASSTTERDSRANLNGRRTSTPGLPSKQELEKREFDRLYQEFLAKEANRESAEISDQEKKLGQLWSVENPGYTADVRESEHNRKFIDYEAAGHSFESLKLKAGQNPHSYENLSKTLQLQWHNYENLKVMRRSHDYLPPPLLNPGNTKEIDESDSVCFEDDLSLDSPLVASSSTDCSFSSVGYYGEDNDDYHIISKFIPDKPAMELYVVPDTASPYCRIMRDIEEKK